MSLTSYLCSNPRYKWHMVLICQQDIRIRSYAPAADLPSAVKAVIIVHLLDSARSSLLLWTYWLPGEDSNLRMTGSKPAVFSHFTTRQRTPKGLVVTPNLPQLQNIFTAMIRTSHMSVLCILGFLFRDANRIYKQTSLFTGGSSQSRTAINRATIYRLTIGLTTHIVRRTPDALMEQYTGFEPVMSAWKAEVLPLH